MIEIGAALDRLLAYSTEIGAGSISADVTALRDRLVEGRFYVAVIGQFKRGKSTLINALLGDELLPSGTAPVTSAVTIVRHGLKTGALIHFQDGTEREIAPAWIPSFITEEGNPGNSKKVAAVEVFAPASLLSTGLCLVDTPGLGSVIDENSEVTRSFVPQIDAAIVVLGADPPITGEELKLVSAVSSKVEDLIFVLNKADRTTAQEKMAAAHFCRTALQRKGIQPPERFFEISSTEALTGHDPSRDWSMLLTKLTTLSSQSPRLVGSAGLNGYLRLSGELASAILDRLNVLALTVAEFERRLIDLHQCSYRVEKAIQDLGYVVQYRRGQMEEWLSEERSRLVSGPPRAGLSGDVSAPSPPREASLEFERKIHDFANKAVAKLGAEYRDAVKALSGLAAEMLSTIFPEHPPDEDSISMETQFQVHWNDVNLNPIQSNTRWLLYRLASARRVGESRQAHHQRAEAIYLKRAIRFASGQIACDLSRQIEECTSRLEARVRTVLEELSRRNQEALDYVRAQHSSGAAGINSARERLKQIQAEIKELDSRVSG